MIDNALKELAKMVKKNEKTLWYGKPDKKCFILECIFNPLLIVAIVWLLLDLSISYHVWIDMGKDKIITAFAIPILMVHLLPVWLYLIGALMSLQKYKNTAYIITSKGIYASGGIIIKKQEMKPFSYLSHVDIYRGIFDQYIGVGDVISWDEAEGGISIRDIRDYENVFEMIKSHQTDVYTDATYPTALRLKEENPEHNT